MGIRLFLIVVTTILSMTSAMAAKKTTTTESVTTKKYEALPPKDVPAQEIENVSATPLDKPLSDQLREKRQQLEMDTEERINQELERARIEDEKIRGEKILSGNSFQPVSVVPVLKKATTVSTKVETVETEPSKSKSLYFGIMGGALNYPQVSNLDTLNQAVGASIGLALPVNFWLEASFLYSQQDVQINNFISKKTEQVEHIAAAGSAVYRWKLAQWINPFAGLALAYTRRQTNGDAGTSNAVDGGLVLGTDFPVFKYVSLGLEYRYMTNIDYDRTNKPKSGDVALQQLATGTQVKNLESMDYQLVFINTKLTF
jgi:opacity protein-like surface antigen